MIYLLDNIQNRASGLSFISETDADINAFVVGRDVEVLTPQAFANAIHEEPEAVEEFCFDNFFGQINMVKSGALLKEYLEANLEQLTEFRVGSVRRDVFAVGLYNGFIVGVKTFAVET